MTHTTDPALIERAAEAIWAVEKERLELEGGLAEWPAQNAVTRDHCLDLARAALSAIPEAEEDAVRAERPNRSVVVSVDGERVVTIEDVFRFGELITPENEKTIRWALDELSKFGRYPDGPRVVPRSIEPEVAALREALTPSAMTKADYIGEFKFRPQEDGAEVAVPWTTIKEIMARILVHATSHPILDKDGK